LGEDSVGIVVVVLNGSGIHQADILSCGANNKEQKSSPQGARRTQRFIVFLCALGGLRGEILFDDYATHHLLKIRTLLSFGEINRHLWKRYMEGLGGHDMTERIVPKGLVDDLRRLIVEARQDVARTVNSSLAWIPMEGTRPNNFSGANP